jgi:hypothetical protein
LVVNVDVSIYMSQLLAGGQADLADAVFQPVNQGDSETSGIEMKSNKGGDNNPGERPVNARGGGHRIQMTIA